MQKRDEYLEISRTLKMLKAYLAGQSIEEKKNSVYNPDLMKLIKREKMVKVDYNPGTDELLVEEIGYAK